MQITNCGRGIHKREVKGIERLQAALPNDWYAFTNLDVALGLGVARELDLIVVTHRQLLLIDIKDWNGRIESGDESWFLNDVDHGRSPVRKILDIARDVSILLREALKSRPETRSKSVPNLVGLAVLTGRADRSGIAATERAKVLTADEFIAKVATPKAEREAFGNVAEQILREPLTDPFWRDQLTRFLNAGRSSPLKPGRRRFQGFVADEHVTHQHPGDVYREYDAWEEGTPQNLGTLRLWDFTKCPDTRFQSEEARLEIAGREGKIYHWLRDRGEDVDRVLLPPRVDDASRGVRYWEVYDRRRRLMRLSEFAGTEATKLPPASRVELARQLLAALAAMHRHGAAHLDLGAHSVWLEMPTTVRLSHLLAAKYRDVPSIGEFRYQFLSSVTLPEDVHGEHAGPQRRDVYLVAVAVHSILFGQAPMGTPPEWKAEIDAGRLFEPLHGWFAEALDIIPTERFADAGSALEAFNKATASRPTPEEVLEGLGRFRSTIRSQVKLVATYPFLGETFRESDRVDSWRSVRDGASVVVKMWKQAAWGDLRREGARILAFLERAAAMRADRPPGLPPILDVLWLGDAIVVVQDYVDGIELGTLLQEPSPDRWTARAAVALVARIAGIVDVLHEKGIGHGDLKPENVVVRPDGEPVLIDVLDFSPAADGEIRSSAYAPESGTVFERDRFAVTRIVEETFAGVPLDQRDAAGIAVAVRECREKVPALATLQPLIEAIQKVAARLDTEGAVPAREEAISVALYGAALGPIEPDEGYLYLRLFRQAAWTPLFMHVRGAAEEIVVRLDGQGQAASGERRPLEQGRIVRVSPYEFHKVAAGLTVARADLNDLSGLSALLEDPTVRTAVAGAAVGVPALAVEEEAGEPVPSGEEADDLLTEEIMAAIDEVDVAQVDIRALWRALIDIEDELKTEGVAQSNSRYSRERRRHMVAFELQSGVFDYERNDTVGVLRQDRRGGWRRVGELDLQASRPGMVVIEAADLSVSSKSQFVEAGQRLQFVSNFEVQSFRRRKGAVDLILGGGGRSSELFSVFDPRSRVEPQRSDHMPDMELIDGYGLNEDQKAALVQILAARPVGLLQGPPGTGKTTFIAALTHYAVTKGLARNVLLASQSHEAVNNAAEAVLALFRGFGAEPDILRIATDEEVVSDPLRPFHSARIERGFKDRFRASFAERIAVVGRTLGVADDTIADLVLVDTTIRSIAARVGELRAAAEPDPVRIAGLLETLGKHVARLGLSGDISLDGDLEALSDELIDRLAAKRWRRQGIDDARIARLRAAAAVGRDFVGSASRAQRSFETFLAGTRQIVAGTCVGLGRNSLGLTATAFDLVIIDEAARCTAGELLVPLQAARWAVLVGDQAQLEPQHEPEVVDRVAARTGIAKREVRRSDFDRVFAAPYAEAAGARLTIQYRMLPPIGALVSEAFYRGLELRPGRRDPEVDPQVLPEGLRHPLTWVETDALGEAAFEERPQGGSSRTNRVEADAIVAMLEGWLAHEPFLEWLTAPKKHPVGIGVICMYGAQRDLIYRKLLRSASGHLLGRHIKVGTVDSYQGKENTIILLSLVRNNDAGYEQAGVKTIRPGFLSAPNRINVAASRAKDRLVIVGARTRWRSGSPLDRLASGFARQVIEGAAVTVPVAEAVGSDAFAKPAGSGGRRSGIGRSGDGGGDGRR